MRRFHGLVLFASLLFISAQGRLVAQETPVVDSVEKGPWTTGGSVAVNFNQVALSNWSGGGENTVTVGGLIGLMAHMDDGKGHWANDLELGYGLTKIGDADLRKSNDKLTFVSKYDYNATTTLFYSGLVDFRTQMTDGFDYGTIDSLGEPKKISELLAPGYLSVGLGMTWKPTASFEILVAPISNRLIIVLDDQLSAAGAFGVDPGRKLESELGATSRLKFAKEIFENVSYDSKLNLFAPYENFTTVVVTWENLLNLRVNDFLTTSISLEVRYDEAVDITRDDGTVGPATQVKEALSVGVGYSF